MKNKILLVILSISFSANLFGQQTNSDSTLIIQLENDYAKALVNRDEAVINGLLADDFIYTENEKLYNRTEVMQSALSISDTIVSAYNEDMQVHIKDKTAIVTGWLFVNGKSIGGNFKRKYRFTDVWYKNKNKWQLIAAQDYLLP